MPVAKVVLVVIASSVVAALAIWCVVTKWQNDTHLEWGFRPKRQELWLGYGKATAPVNQGDYVIYLGGYHWTNHCYVHVINRRTGKEAWTSTEPAKELVIGDDTVCLANGGALAPPNPRTHHLLPTTLTVYQLHTGKMLWQKQFPDSTVLSKPGINWDYETLLPVIYLSSDDGNKISAIDWMSGHELWSSTSFVLLGRIADTNAEMVVGLDSGPDLVFLDERTGKKTKALALDNESKQFLESENKYDPEVKLYSDVPALRDRAHRRYEVRCRLVSRDHIFLTKDNLLAGIDCVTGQTEFVTAVGKAGEYVSDVAESAGKLFLVVSRPGPERQVYVQMFDPKQRKLGWRTHTNKVSGLHVFGSFLLMTSVWESKSYAINPADGSILWTADIGGTPCLAHRTLFISGWDLLYACDPLTGRVLWTFKPDQWHPGVPLFAGELLYLTAEDGNLYALRVDR